MGRPPNKSKMYISKPLKPNKNNTKAIKKWVKPIVEEIFIPLLNNEINITLLKKIYEHKVNYSIGPDIPLQMSPRVLKTLVSLQKEFIEPRSTAEALLTKAFWLEEVASGTHSSGQTIREYEEDISYQLETILLNLFIELIDSHVSYTENSISMHKQFVVLYRCKICQKAVSATLNPGKHQICRNKKCINASQYLKAHRR